MLKRAALSIFLLGTATALAQGTGHQHPGSAPQGGVSARQPNSDDKDALVKDALSAAPPMIAKTAVVKDWDGTVLRPGDDAYTCFPTQADKRKTGQREPMCLDKVWLSWGDAWMNKKPFKAERVGVAYMLAGDTGASNVDPFATAKTRDNQWVVEGPHIMVLLTDATQLDVLPTDPMNGGPYVMWKGTPYAHVMVPVGKRPPVTQ